MDRKFAELSDITDRVARINSPYESDLGSAFTDMENFIEDAISWNIPYSDRDMFTAYKSHMSFHREVVSEIIREARELLMDDRRHFLKRLVSYHKEFSKWFDRLDDLE